VWLSDLFRRPQPADEELKVVIEQQLKESKESIERLRDAGVPIPPIPWDVADRDVVINFQRDLEDIRQHLSQPNPKQSRRTQ
jgi:hypothetical protein